MDFRKDLEPLTKIIKLPILSQINLLNTMRRCLPSILPIPMTKTTRRGENFQPPIVVVRKAAEPVAKTVPVATVAPVWCHRRAFVPTMCLVPPTFGATAVPGATVAYAETGATAVHISFLFLVYFFSKIFSYFPLYKKYYSILLIATHSQFFLECSLRIALS